jgi:hypothetical protein
MICPQKDFVSYHAFMKYMYMHVHAYFINSCFVPGFECLWRIVPKLRSPLKPHNIGTVLI